MGRMLEMNDPAGTDITSPREGAAMGSGVEPARLARSQVFWSIFTWL